MIQLDQLSIRRGGRVLFQKASMQLHPGWKIGLTGVNGAGKSTLFSALLGGMESPMVRLPTCGIGRSAYGSGNQSTEYESH